MQILSKYQVNYLWLLFKELKIKICTNFIQKLDLFIEEHSGKKMM